MSASRATAKSGHAGIMRNAFFIFACLVIALVVLDQVALWMARRGWIHWRRTPARSAGGGMAGVLTEFQQLVEPQVRHVIEDREERRVVRLSLPARGRDTQPNDPRE